MTRTEELLALAEAATPGPWETNKADAISESIEVTTPHGWISVADASPYDALFIAAAHPETIKQLVELVRLQHEALKWAAEIDAAFDGEASPEITDAIAAFNRFEQGGE